MTGLFIFVRVILLKMHLSFKRILLLHICLFCLLNIKAQIISGPMLGYKTMREVAVWIQTEHAQEVIFQYRSIDGRSKWAYTSATTEEREAYTHTFIAKNLRPGTNYIYSIFVKDDQANAIKGKFSTQLLWQYRTDPPDFSFAFGSCAYLNDEMYDRPGEPYGKGNAIFNTIAQKESDFMLWLGDNIYLREADIMSESGINYRYTHMKSNPSLQTLWKKMHHYAIWDDHDYGPNDADRSFINKEESLNAFNRFWANPSQHPAKVGGITSMFSYNDLDFFLLDNRYNRSPNERKGTQRQILGDAQIEWLIDALVSSKASFKIVAVGGQFLSPAAVYENHATFPEERKKLLKLIEDEGIQNLIFLSGDRHKTELTEMEFDNGTVLYDYTSSPLTSTAYDTSDEGNTIRVKGTHVSTQNFGMIEVSGPISERKLLLKAFDEGGNLLWKHSINKQ